MSKQVFNRLFRCTLCKSGVICTYEDIKKGCLHCKAPFEYIVCVEEFNCFSPSLLSLLSEMEDYDNRKYLVNNKNVVLLNAFSLIALLITTLVIWWI